MNIKSKIAGIGAFFLFITPLLASAGTQEVQFSCVSISSYLKVGSTDVSTSGGVTTLQNFLKTKNYFTLNSTGYFGNLTLASVKKFQLDNGLPSTGFVGPMTIAKIKEMSCASPVVTNTPETGTLASMTLTTTKKKSGGGGSSHASSNKTSNQTVVTSTEEVSTTTSMTITSPNGGETFTAGDIMTINWIAKNIPQNSSVSFTLMDSSSNNYNYAIAENISTSTNSYSWKIPTNVVAGNYKLRMFCGMTNSEQGCGDNSVEDSDAGFTINATTTENHAPVITSFDPTPAGIGVGDSVKFHWAMSDEDGDALGWKFETSQGITSNPCPNPNVSESNEVTEYESFYHPGNYTAVLTVDDCRGGVATTTSTFNVSTENSHEISILNPVGGEALVRGKKYGVTWSTHNYNADANISIYLDNGNWNEKTLLAGNMKNTGIATIVIPKDTPLNNLYIIEVDVTDGRFTDGDRTDNYISITDASTTPYITLLSPNGNESFKVGDTVNITWDTDIASTTDMFLQLEDTRYEGDIASHYSPIAGYSTPIPNTGSYSWTIPDSLGTGYMKLNGGNVYGLTIANYGDGEVYDSSNNLFSIATSTDEVINVDLTSTCSTTHFDTDRAIGSTGNDVVALQNFLMAKGYGAATTGYFGSNTRSSLMAYQVSRGITPVDGYFGELTRAAVAEDCMEPSITLWSPNTEDLRIGVPFDISWSTVKIATSTIISFQLYDSVADVAYGLNKAGITSTSEDPNVYNTGNATLVIGDFSPAIPTGHYVLRAYVIGMDFLHDDTDNLVHVSPKDTELIESITLSDLENESTTTETVVTE